MGGCLSCRLKSVRDHRISLPESVTCYSFKSLKKATNNFKIMVRRDGFSCSYKGTLDDGSQVMVIVYTKNKSSDIDFTSIVRNMGGVKHENVVELVGYCFEGDHRMLVHEFIGDHSLNHLIFDSPNAVLDWPKRLLICHGIAHALDYLHTRHVLVHQVKPRNFFIDKSFNPKFLNIETSDLLLEDFRFNNRERVMGTCGYLDPEYTTIDRSSLNYMDPEHILTGSYSEKTSVYAFGISLLEIISGRKRKTNDNDTCLVNQAWELRESGRILEIVDPNLGEYSEEEMTRFVNVALSCVQSPSNLRPSMSQVRSMLSNGFDISNLALTRPLLWN